MTAKIVPIKDNEDAALRAALAELQLGLPIGLPTETVYGLAGDATNPEAITRIYETKGRPSFNPLIAHVGTLAMAEAQAEFSSLAHLLAEKFWPGALTIVLPLKASHTVHELATAGLDTVALRMPCGFANRLITAFGKPLAAPSANLSGKISTTDAQHVADDLGERINLILDDGRTPIGVESTIVKIDGEQIYLLRPGGIASETIEEVARRPLLRLTGDTKIQAPGMLSSHYAPNAQLVLDATECAAGDALIRFGASSIEGQAQAAIVLDLSPSGDLAEAAANLFHHLKAADASGAQTIRVASIPSHGLGEAIIDRLQRAAAPRD